MRPAGTAGAPDAAVVVGWSRTDRLVVWAGFPAAGALVGFIARQLVSWLARVPVMPMRDVLAWIDSWPEPWLTRGCVAAGVALGAVLAGIGRFEMLQVRLSTDRIELRRKGTLVALNRAGVSAAYLDGKRLVLLGPDTREAYSAPCELDTTRLAAALEQLGWPWRRAGDPHREAYRRWLPGGAEPGQAATALLAERRRALRRRDADEAAQLRADLNDVGIVVRDDGGHQFWRPADLPR